MKCRALRMLQLADFEIRTRELGPRLSVPTIAPRHTPLTVRYQLPGTASQYWLDVLDVRGRRLAYLATGPARAGHHTARWEPASQGVACGLYLIRLQTTGQTITRRVVLLGP
jgi:hypothetical protein